MGMLSLLLRGHGPFMQRGSACINVVLIITTTPRSCNPIVPFSGMIIDNP